jgi:hypothetical protein
MAGTRIRCMYEVLKAAGDMHHRFKTWQFIIEGGSLQKNTIIVGCL